MAIFPIPIDCSPYQIGDSNQIDDDDDTNDYFAAWPSTRSFYPVVAACTQRAVATRLINDSWPTPSIGGLGMVRGTSYLRKEIDLDVVAVIKSGANGRHFL